MSTRRCPSPPGLHVSCPQTMSCQLTHLRRLPSTAMAAAGLPGHHLPLVATWQAGQGDLEPHGGGVEHLAQAAQTLALDTPLEAALQGAAPKGLHPDGHHG